MTFANPQIKPGSRKPVIQAKLAIGQPGDKFEQEADSMAENAMQMTQSEDSYADTQSYYEEADILIFSGHQYAQYKVPGMWKDGGTGTGFDIRNFKGPMNNVKLIKSTGCATICRGAYDVLDVASGAIEYWDGKKWISLNASQDENKCRVKGDYSGSWPDPRTTSDSQNK